MHLEAESRISIFRMAIKFGMRHDMRFRKAGWMPGLCVSFVLALAACSGPDATATPVPTAAPSPRTDVPSQQSGFLPTAEESLYLSAVVGAEQSSIAIFQAFGNIISQTYPLRETLIAALLEAGVGTPFIRKTEVLAELDPPERFREDHRIWLEASREMLRIDTEAAKVVEAGDLVRFSVLNGQLNGVNVAARIAVSPVFCRGVGQTEEQSVICTPDDFALDGYQTTINDLIRRFMPEFATLQGNLGFRLSLTAEELNQVLSQTATNSLDAMQGFATELETVTPPDELAADHERLRAIFTLSLEIVSEVKRLGEAGDLDGARGELLKLDPAFCNARANFEAQEFKDAIAILFLGGLRTCGGTSF
jgi:hypothetical protein